MYVCVCVWVGSAGAWEMEIITGKEKVVDHVL